MTIAIYGKCAMRIKFPNAKPWHETRTIGPSGWPYFERFISFSRCARMNASALKMCPSMNPFISFIAARLLNAFWAAAGFHFAAVFASHSPFANRIPFRRKIIDCRANGNIGRARIKGLDLIREFMILCLVTSEEELLSARTIHRRPATGGRRTRAAAAYGQTTHANVVHVKWSSANGMVC